jgi:hypothetical protein
MCSTNPFSCVSRCSTPTAASSARRNAPVKPTSRSAWSRNPASEEVPSTCAVGVASSMSHNNGGMIGSDRCGGAPSVRRMPSHTATTRGSSSCDGSPAVRSANRNEESLATPPSRCAYNTKEFGSSRQCRLLIEQRFSDWDRLFLRSP